MEAEGYLAERVRQALAEDPRIGEVELHVSVVGDRVVVQGTLPTEERREAVVEVVRRIAPDHECVNETTVVNTEAEPREEEIS
jgi:polyhydroxyalkanoate synthesis regulator phasin